MLACKKDEEKETQSTQLPPNFLKVKKFVSIASNLKEDELKYDEQKKQFYLPNTTFFYSLEQAQNDYLQANVYKEEYEK